MESTNPPTPSSSTHLRTSSNSGEPTAAYSPPTHGMISCPTFSRSVSDARVRSTQRWSAEESGEDAPGFAGPSRCRADASTPGARAGWKLVDAGAHASAVAARDAISFLCIVGIWPGATPAEQTRDCYRPGARMQFLSRSIAAAESAWLVRIG